MRKNILLLGIMLSVSAISFAQIANVKKAFNKAGATENPDFTGAIELIDAAKLDESTKNLAQTWYTAGYIYDKMQDFEALKKAKGQTPDEAVVGKSAISAYDNFIKAYDLDQLPNEKGQVKPKYDKKIRSTLLYYYRQMILVNYGIKLYSSSDYDGAIGAFERHLGMLDLPMMAGEKELPQKDSTYYQIMYYNAVCYSIKGDQKNAARIYEQIKQKGFEENKIHQFLYTIYKDENDTTNYVRILEEGAARFPNEFFYLGTLIDHYIRTGDSKLAADYLDQAIAKDAANPVYYNAKGLMMSQLGNFDEAIINYDKAIELDPSSADALINRGLVAYNQAVEIDNRAQRISNAAMAAAEQKKVVEKYKEALGYFERADKLAPENLDNLKLMRALYFRFEQEAKYSEVNARIKAL